jgi:hypothetical protein
MGTRSGVVSAAVDVGDEAMMAPEDTDRLLMGIIAAAGLAQLLESLAGVATELASAAGTVHDAQRHRAWAEIAEHVVLMHSDVIDQVAFVDGVIDTLEG